MTNNTAVPSNNSASSSTRAALENKCIAGIRELSDGSLQKIWKSIENFRIKDTFLAKNNGHVGLDTLGVKNWARIGGFLDHQTIASLELCFRPLRRQPEWQQVWQRFLSDTKNPQGVVYACRRLRHTPASIKQMAKLLSQSNPKVRKVAMDMLLALDAVQEVVDQATSDSTQARVQVAHTLGRFPPTQGLAATAGSLLDDDHEAVRGEAVRSLSRMGVLAEEYSDQIAACVNDDAAAVRLDSAKCLQKFSQRNNNKPFGLDKLIGALATAPARSVLEEALLNAIAVMGVEGNGEIIARLPSSKDERKIAILNHVMPEFVTKGSVSTLIDCCRVPSPKVRAAAVMALGQALRPLNKREYPWTRKPSLDDDELPHSASFSSPKPSSPYSRRSTIHGNSSPKKADELPSKQISKASTRASLNEFNDVVPVREMPSLSGLQTKRGEISSLEAVEAIADRLDDRDEDVRFLAVACLADIRATQYFDKVYARLSDDQSMDVKNITLQAFELLAKPGEESIIKPIKTLLDHHHPSYRLAGVRAITVAMADDPDQCLETLHPFLQDNCNAVVKAALDGVVNLSNLQATSAGTTGEERKRAAKVVAGFLHDNNPEIRVASALALGRMGDEADLCHVNEMV